MSVEEKPPPDPAKLLAFWMEWEKGETPPGRVIANLKTAGLRELLEATILVQQEAFVTADGAEAAPLPE